MFPNRERPSRARQLPGSPLPRLVSTHHPGHDCPDLPRYSRPPPSREKRGSTSSRPATGDHAVDNTTTSPIQLAPTPPLRRRIRLTLAEIRGLFNLRDQAKRVIHTAINWSTYRRQHQAEARRHHFRRRLKIQYLAL